MIRVLTRRTTTVALVAVSLLAALVVPVQTAQAAYDCGLSGVAVNGTTAVRTGDSWMAHTMTDSFTVAITYPEPRDRRVHVYLHPFLNGPHSTIHYSQSKDKSHVLLTYTATFTFSPRPEYVDERPPFRDQFPFTFNILYIRNGNAADVTRCSFVTPVKLTVHKLQLHRPTIIELDPLLPPGLQKVVAEEPLEDKPQEGRPEQPEQGEPEGSGPPPTTTTTQPPPPTTTTTQPPPPTTTTTQPPPPTTTTTQPPPPTTTTTQPPQSLDDAIACYEEWTCTTQDLLDAHAADRERRRQEAAADRQERQETAGG